MATVLKEIGGQLVSVPVSPSTQEQQMEILLLEILQAFKEGVHRVD